MHSNTHANWSGTSFKEVCYLQSNQVLNYPPLAFKEFPSCESLLSRMSVQLTEISLLVFSCRSIWPSSKPNHLKHTGVFCRLCGSRSDIHTLETCYLISLTAEWTPLTHSTLFQKTWGKSSTLRTQTRVSVKPISFVLVANAMSVCNLVSTLLSWVYQGSCFCFINVLFLSQRWQWWWAGAGNTGVHCELTVASLSSSG